MDVKYNVNSYWNVATAVPIVVVNAKTSSSMAIVIKSVIK